MSMDSRKTEPQRWQDLHDQRSESQPEHKCPRCGGLGWNLYNLDITDYGLVLFADLCPACRKILRAAADNGLPENFVDADISKFDFNRYSRKVEKLEQISRSFVRDFTKWDRYQKGLYLWSEVPGSGKTFLASCLGRSVSIKHDVQFKFIASVDFLAKLSDSYKRPEGSEDPAQIYYTCKLLILDDLGSEKRGDWQRAELFRLINARAAAGLITIITSNAHPEKLTTVDQRTIDRIFRSCIVLQMPEESIRSKLAAEEQENFLEEILSGK